MTKKNNSVSEKKHGLTFSRAILSLLVVGFSLISIINVCKFMIVLYGMSLGILISLSIEVTRLICLYIFVRKGKGIKMLAVVAYIIVAGVSFWCNVSAFQFEITKKEVAGLDHYRPHVHKIKQEYSHRVAEKVAGVAKEIRRIERILSSYPNSATWKRRLATAVARKSHLETERDEFLRAEPKNPEQWIREKSALLEMALPVKSSESEDIEAVSKTLKDLWGVNKSQAQQLVGIVITAMVELSILLISFIAGAVDRSRDVAGMAQKPQGATRLQNHKPVASHTNGGGRKATTEIEGEPLKRFVAAYKGYWKETGELPQTKRLSRKFREVRKFLVSISREELEKIFEE